MVDRTRRAGTREKVRITPKMRYWGGEVLSMCHEALSVLSPETTEQYAVEVYEAMVACEPRPRSSEFERLSSESRRRWLEYRTSHRLRYLLTKLLWFVARQAMGMALALQSEYVNADPSSIAPRGS